MRRSRVGWIALLAVLTARSAHAQLPGSWDPYEAPPRELCVSATRWLLIEGSGVALGAGYSRNLTRFLAAELVVDAGSAEGGLFGVAVAQLRITERRYVAIPRYLTVGYAYAASDSDLPRAPRHGGVSIGMGTLAPLTESAALRFDAQLLVFRRGNPALRLTAGFTFGRH